MNYIVTGSCGFIGYHTSKVLLDAGHNVFGWDKWGYPHKDHWREPLPEWPEYQAERKRNLKAYPNYEHTIVDLSNPTLLRNMPWPEADCLIHLAAMPGVRASFINPYQCVLDNIVATTNVLEECRRRGITNMVMASSSSVYGDGEIPFNEEQRCDHPKSIYAAAKRSIELIAHAYASQYGMDITCLRFFTVYGPLGRQDMFPDKCIKALHKGDPITVFGDGNQLRDWTYVDDIVKGIILASETPNGYRIINLGANSPMTVLDYIEATASAMGTEAAITLADMDKADALATWADTTKAQAMGWEAKADGIQSTVDWWKGYVASQQRITKQQDQSCEVSSQSGYQRP